MKYQNILDDAKKENSPNYKTNAKLPTKEADNGCIQLLIALDNNQIKLPEIK